MRVVWRALCVIVVLALQIVIVASPGFEPDAAAQVTCTAGSEPELAACINDYNSAASDRVIRLTSGIRLTGDLPAIDNSAPSSPKLTIDGQDHSIDGDSLAEDVLEQDSGDTTITNVYVFGATSSGIQNDSGPMTIMNSTISDNTDNGIFANSPSGTTMINSTFIYNGLDGIRVNGGDSATVLSSTIAFNDEEGISAFGQLSIGGSLISSNTVNCDVIGLGGITDLGGNISDDLACGVPNNAALPGTIGAALCAAPCVPTIIIFANSPAIDADPACAGGLSDQRGVVRVAGLCDAGAYEAGDCAQATTTVTDEVEFAFAIGCYNARTTPATIQLANDIVMTDILPAINNLTLVPPRLTIDGQGHTLDGDLAAFGILRLANGELVITDITLTRSANNAVDHDGGVLLITNSTLTGNVDFGVDANSLIETVITNSTIEANEAGVVATALGSVLVQSSTVVRNDIGFAGGGTVRAAGSLITDNGIANCSVLTFVDDGGNVVGDISCNGIVTAGIAGTLGPLADNGCATPCTQTIALPVGSPAIDADTGCAAGLLDQRGFARTTFECDAGSYEATISTATCNGLAVTIDMNLGASGIGTAGNDVIFGTPGPDVIDGMGGDDTICGEGGDDNITGGAGVDFMFGGEGNDTMLGGDGNDRIRGQQGVDTIGGNDGNDFLYGGIEGDTINGGNGNDTIGGFGGADMINGGPGNDKIFGGFGADTITGGMDDDSIRGLVGNDIITGGPGDDDLNGDNGQDTINGSAGNDTIRGGNSVDTLFGDDGDDNVAGGKSEDALSGGAGNDTCAGNTGTDTVDATCEIIFSVP